MKKLIKGIILGIGNVIPGLCSATLALILGIYDELLDSIIDLVNIKKWRYNFFFYLGIVIGIIIGIFILSKLYTMFPSLLIFCFIGFVIRSYPIKLSKDGKMHYLFFIMGLIIIFLFKFIEVKNFNSLLNLSNPLMKDFVLLALSGFFSSIALVMPGVSGALILVILGVYFPLLDIIKNTITSIFYFKLPNLNNIIILIIFILSFMVGLITSSVIIKKLLKKHDVKCENLINGMILGTIFVLSIDIVNSYQNLHLLIIGIVFLIIISFFNFSDQKTTNLKKSLK